MSGTLALPNQAEGPADAPLEARSMDVEVSKLNEKGFRITLIH